MKAAITRGWNNFWFGAQSPTNLAICRVIFFGGLLYQRFDINTARWAELGQAFWFPIAVFQRLSIPLLSASTLRVLDIVWLCALGLSCIGLFTRAATMISAIVGFYLIALPHNFGKTHHSDAILIFILIAFALSKCDAKWSVDAWRRQRLGIATPSMSGEYRWPIRVAWLAWVLLYFAAGISKLSNAGLAWAFSDSFRNVLIEHHYTHHPLVDWGLTIAEYPLLCQALAAGALLMETLAPVALVHPYARAVFAPSLGMMQFGIWLLMGVKFAPFLLVFAFWIPWEEGAQWVMRSWRSGKVVPDLARNPPAPPP